jgi:hypothetical protein
MMKELLIVNQVTDNNDNDVDVNSMGDDYAAVLNIVLFLKQTQR